MARPNRITHNGGRLRGAKGKLPERRRQAALAIVERLNKQGITPLDVMLRVMHLGFEKSGILPEQYQAAVAAAPYAHPKLQAIAYQEAPDDAREKRRNLLARIPYEKRREIAAILAAAALGEDEDSAPQIEGEPLDG